MGGHSPSTKPSHGKTVVEAVVEVDTEVVAAEAATEVAVVAEEAEMAAGVTRLALPTNRPFQAALLGRAIDHTR